MVIAEIFQNKIQRFVTKAIFIINAVNMLKKDFNVYKDLSWKLKNLNSRNVSQNPFSLDTGFVDF